MSSRRKFLKQAVGGTGAAWQALRGAATRSLAEPNLQGNSRAANVPAPRAPATPVSTRGVGVYPGDPAEYFGPAMVPAGNEYRNLALHRPAYHSSSYDYNLTAQLVTDGIKHTETPRWVSVAANLRGPLPKHEREFVLDHNPTSTVELRGPRPWLQIHLGGGASAPKIDRVDLLVIAPRGQKPENLSFAISASDEGREWKKVGSVTNPKPASLAGLPLGFAAFGQLFDPSILLGDVSQSRFYRVECEAGNAPPLASWIEWQIGEVAFYYQNQRVEIGGPYNFTSAWKSAGLDEEWVYVDLGAPCEFDRVVLHWIARPAEGAIQVSDDAETWSDLAAFPGGASLTDDLKLAPPAHGRFVRAFMKRPSSPDGYILSEFEVYGHGGLLPQAAPAPAQRGNRLNLAGGAWRVQRDSLVEATGEKLSLTGFRDADWVIATVPGTTLASYLNAGAIPDPNFGDNQFQISDSFFYADFWYRTEFTAPTFVPGQHVWLNFDGINWKAEAFLNGEKLDRIEGGFFRGRFEVTGKIRPGPNNALAVRVEKNATPGSVKQKTFESPGKNGGALGADNPTYHASIGWDWIPTIRGRNTGIWAGVYLEITGPVTLGDPLIATHVPLPDKSHANVSIDVDLVNHENKIVSGTLLGHFGDAEFEQKVTLDGGETKTISLNPANQPDLRIDDPKFWWPAGYGEPNLYDVELSFELSGARVSDTKKLKAGIRQLDYSVDDGALKIYINGRRFVARGGNWGFGESLLRYRAREYDTAVRYHREMNFTMIRNWVGQVGDDAFYEACDRHGIMVWQDFWLANPWDGPDPDDNDLFLRNARDFVCRIRRHPCIGLYCGRNEGYPPKPLEEGLHKILSELHPGVRYISSSADDVVSGHGPYQAMPVSFYFGPGTDPKLHSEMGMPNIPPLDSVRAMMPESSLWPQGLDWGLHDFCLEGAQGGASFRTLIDETYGGATSLEEWVTLAQFVNYDGYRAMFEAQSKYRMGLLLWMSHPCWPSFVWQTYDYYFQPTAAYFGCKKASEPLHIHWNPVTDQVEVVNYSGGNQKGLTAQVEILNLDGASKWNKSATLDCNEDSVNSPIKMEYPPDLSAVHFIRLKLVAPGPSPADAAPSPHSEPALSEAKGEAPKGGATEERLISENFYLRGTEEGNLRAIRKLPKIHVNLQVTRAQHDDKWLLTAELRNLTSDPALMVWLKLVRSKSGDRILPAVFSDNYVSLMPGEHRTIQIEVKIADCRGEEPYVAIEGFNVAGAVMS